MLGESGAICDYICARYSDGRLTPGPSDPDFADHLFWFHWSNGTFMTTLMMQLVLAGGGPDNPAAVFVDDQQPARLGDGRKKTGRGRCSLAARTPTTADIMMVYCLTTSRAFLAGTPLEGFPNLKAYLARIGARAPPISGRWPRPSRA